MDERYARFSTLVLNINRFIQKLKNAQMSEIGLKGNQVQCMYYLHTVQDGLNARQLEELCQEDKAAISRTLSALEKKGLIYLENTSLKVYRNPYRLTPKGIECGNFIAQKIDDFVDMASKGLSEEARKSLYSSLELIYDNLKAICKEE